MDTNLSGVVVERILEVNQAEEEKKSLLVHPALAASNSLSIIWIIV
jgi:hypothetical protein